MCTSRKINDTFATVGRGGGRILHNDHGRRTKRPETLKWQ